VLDTVGIGFGGYLSEPSQMIQALVKELNGPLESTVFGSGLKTSCLYATLANGVMVRYLDYMDNCFLTKDARKHTGHHGGESIPPILAVSERQRSTGKDVITAIVSAYELLNRISDSVVEVTNQQDWTSENVKVPCVIALVTGNLLGLSEAQMANAVAVAGSFNASLGILNGSEEEHTMARNLRFAQGAHGGICAALLAEKGFKGPLNVFEGRHGIAEVMTDGEMNLEKLRQPRKDWTILNTWIKNFPCGGSMHGQLEATLTLVKEHNIRAEDVREIRVRTNSRSSRILANPATRRSFKTKYTADHSSYYCTAIAILDRAVGPEQFSNEKLRDSRVRQLAEKIVIEPDPRLDEFLCAGIVEITTNKGDKYHCEVLLPKGHPLNPMADADIEKKFRGMAGKFMAERQLEQIIDTIYSLDKINDIHDLTKLLVVLGGH
jgi:2-methylcitrate dehydratase